MFWPLPRAGFTQTTYDTYTNARFGYSIAYPSGILEPQEEAENGDGRVFLSADNSVELRVWGQYNALFQTLKKAYQSDLKERGKGVTYKLLSKHSYVISGVKDGRIYYQKTMLSGKDGDAGAIFCTFNIEYERSEKAKYDPIVRKIARSFSIRVKCPLFSLRYA